MSNTSRMLLGQALRLVALAVERWHDDGGDNTKPSEKIDLLTLEEERTRDRLNRPSLTISA